MEKTQKNNKKILWIGLAAVLILAAVFAIAYQNFREQPMEGAKAIVVEVVHKDGSAKEFSYRTDAEYLGEVLLAEGLIRGTKGEYGLFVEAVDGETADAANQEWWCLTKAGESCMNGVDTTPILDGDHFELTLTVGW